MNYWVFDENGNWFCRNDRGQYSSATFQSYDALLEFVMSTRHEKDVHPG